VFAVENSITVHQPEQKKYPAIQCDDREASKVMLQYLFTDLSVTTHLIYNTQPRNWCYLSYSSLSAVV